MLLQIWKTLETTEKTLIEAIQVKDYDVSKFFTDESSMPKSPHEHAKYKTGRLETETYYLEVSMRILIVEVSGGKYSLIVASNDIKTYYLFSHLALKTVILF